MDRQKQIISQFKKTYPNSTLKRTSELTGIQITRIHRLLQGAPMKLSEWENFNQAIDLKREPAIDLKLKYAFKQCLHNLTLEGKRELLIKLQRLNQLTELVGENPNKESAHDND